MGFSAESYPPQVEFTILQSPTPLIAQDKKYLVYEVYLTNYYPSPITLTSISVHGNKSNDAKIIFTDSDITKMIHLIGSKSDKKPLVIEPGITKLIYMWLPFDSLAAIPVQLIHDVAFNTTRNNENISPILSSEPLNIKKTMPIVIGAPLKGDHWVAGNGPSNTSEHRRAHLILHGHDYFSQRYAIDFVQVDKSGSTYQGDIHKNESYHCYGKDIHAVAAGKVVDLKDGIPENIPNSDKPAVPISLDTVGGNYLLIDMGHGYYAFYAHLIPGSLKVKIGDTVNKDQVIAKLGNSGNSSEPHLHFHVVNKASPMAAEGVPYAFDHFDLRNSKTIPGDLIKVEITDDKLQHMTNQLVLENAVVKFSD